MRLPFRRPSGAQAGVGGPIRGLRLAKARLPPAIILRPSGTTAANRLVLCLNSPPSPLGTCPSLGDGEAQQWPGRLIQWQWAVALGWRVVAPSGRQKSDLNHLPQQADVNRESSTSFRSGVPSAACLFRLLLSVERCRDDD